MEDIQIKNKNIANELEVINKIIVIQGKFGIYHRYRNAVEVINGNIYILLKRA